jgi:hypothetical protein
MNRLRTTLLFALACFATPLALAQWQWIDKDGRKVFSDQPPPAGTPGDKILKRPGNRPPEPEPTAAAPASPSAAAAASMPRVSGKDKELEEKRKQAAAVEADKKKAQEEEQAKLKADNCTRAKQAKATIDSGVRLTVTNPKGEREIMDDNARAAEAKRLDGVISRNCA